MFLFVGVGYLADALLRAVLRISTENSEPTAFITVFIVLWWVYAPYCAVRRLHDMNLSGWWTIFIFVPFANALLLIRLFFFKGTVDKNKYGLPHTRTHILGLGL